MKRFALHCFLILIFPVIAAAQEPIVRTSIKVSGDIVRVDDSRDATPLAKGDIVQAALNLSLLMATFKPDETTSADPLLQAQALTDVTEPTASIADSQEFSAFAPSKHNLVVGEIVSVNQNHSFAVGWMPTQRLIIDKDVIARSADFTNTAILRPTDDRAGRAIGLQVIWGQPQIGDEFYLPNVPQSQWMRQTLTETIH